MRYKVKTITNLTPEQTSALVNYGCKPNPYIMWEREWVSSASCEDSHVQALRNLAWVTSVEPMPTYQVA